MAQRGEIIAAGRLAGDALGHMVGLVEDVQRSISDRVFGGAGPAALPVRVAYDAATAAVYGTVRAAHQLAPRAAAALAGGLAAAAPQEAWSLGALNGIWGDTLAERYPELAVSMTIRREGRDVAVDRQSMARAFPDATPKVAVYVHGLCETDASWARHAREHWGDASATYATMLQRDLGCTPVLLRYNTGLHVSDNGRQLAALLERVASCWPVPVEEVILIGHSMGGLVARSACHYASAEGLCWTAHLAHVVCLGTPHLGAPLEKAVHLGSWLAAGLPETRGLARALNGRSAGVKDLRFGSVVEDDWREIDPDELCRDRCTDVPFLPHAAYSFIGVSLTANPHHPIGALVGDLLVRVPSAAGRGRKRTLPFEAERGRHIGRLNHFDLLNHPAVYDQLRAWLAKTRDHA